MNKVLLLSFILGVSFVAQATPISLQYKGFYRRLKEISTGHYPLIELAFSVPKKNGCIIKKGSINTEKEQFPLTITPSQRIFIPFDASLKTGRTMIKLDMQGDASQCKVAIQIRARQTKAKYDQAEVIALQSQMNKLLKGMVGFPARYFSADIKGVNFEFDHASQVNIDGKVSKIENIFRLSRQRLEKLKSISFSRAPDVVSPWT